MSAGVVFSVLVYRVLFRAVLQNEHAVTFHSDFSLSGSPGGSK